MKTGKIHTTNYFNTLIEIADDCPVTKSEIPEAKAGKPTVASKQYDLLSKSPYKWTSDELLFRIYTEKNDLVESEYPAAREHFFSKGQPRLRTSPLGKRYGFGIHFNAEGKIAVYGMETETYQRLAADPEVKKSKAMRNRKK